MANRTYKFRGTKQPVLFGVEKLDGYIIEATKETIEGEELEIEDEDSNVVAQFSGFGIRNKRTASLIPLKIGGGGLLAARYDITAKQLSESKRQSKLLQKIAENTEHQSGKSELLMK